MQSEIDLPLNQFYPIDTVHPLQQSGSLMRTFHEIFNSLMAIVSKKDVTENFSGAVYLTPTEIEEAISRGEDNYV